jgi:predicted deacylase
MTKPFKLGPIEVQPGTRIHAELPVMKQPDAKILGIPLILLHGTREGPILYVSAGVHGDEPDGTVSVIDIASSLDPSQLAGTFIGAPAVSVPAYLAKASVDVAGIRENPIDWKNLARVYPGRSDGTVTERIADTISNQIFPAIDYAIDLHSGGTRGTSIHLAGFIGVEGKLGKTSLELAKLFPMEIIWRASPWAKISTVAIEHGVPLVISEVTGQGRAEKWDVETNLIGVRNVMKHIGMIEGDLEKIPEKRRYIDSETYIYAQIGGLLRPDVNTGELIKKDQPLGIVQDIYGDVVEKIYSPLDGIVTGVRTKPVVWAGETLFLVANFIPDPLEEGLEETHVEGHITPP